jgi:1-acyl-sn-glycerol-3-phosphate acyltransferase
MSFLYSAGRFAFRSVARLSGWEVRGRERVPETGALIVAANHQSYWDPPLIGSAMSRELHFLAKAELFSPAVFGAVLREVHSIPIRRGMADLSGMSRAISVLQRRDALLVFPEGSRSPDGELRSARPGVGMLAVHGDAMILPCCISGSNQPRRWLFRQAKVRVWFGQPRHWKEYLEPESDLAPGRALYQQLGDAVMREVAVLRTGQMTSASRGAA